MTMEILGNIWKLMENATGTPAEELKRQEDERRAYEASEEYKNHLEENRKKAEELREKQYQEELCKVYVIDETVKFTKTNLNKLVKWSTSRWNDYRKWEVVDSFYKAIKQGEDTVLHYSCGTYTEATGGRGVGDYKLIIYQGVTKLVVNEGWDDGRVYEISK